VELDVSELPLVGGDPALDLVNTLARGAPAAGRAPHDHLTDPDALLRWTRRIDLLDDTEAGSVADAWRHDPGAAAAALDAVRDIREALHTVAAAVADPHPADPGTAGAALERLHCRWVAAAGRSRLVLDPGAAPPARLAVGTVPALLVPDRLAEAALDLLRTVDPTRLRRCPVDAGGCGWLFLDRSRNGSRRWCRMADCGTGVKSRRLTERRRADRILLPVNSEMEEAL
jgi:predicted RNA-binding Zn ribbon-like protein